MPIKSTFTVNIEFVSVYDKIISGIQIFKQRDVFLNNKLLIDRVFTQPGPITDVYLKRKNTVCNPNLSVKKTNERNIASHVDSNSIKLAYPND